MKYSIEEYALLTVEDSFFDFYDMDYYISQWQRHNFAAMNIKVMDKASTIEPIFFKLSQFFDVNIEYCFQNIQYVEKPLKYGSSLKIEFTELDEFMDNLYTILGLNFTFFSLDICLSNCYDMKKIEKLISSINQIVVINPYFKNNDLDIYNYSKFLDWLLKTPYENIRLSNNHIHVNSLRRHPCHIGACKAERCHMRKSGLPKNIYIKKDGSVQLFSKFSIGTLKEKELEDLLYISQENYLDINGKLFTEEIIDYPYDFFPWKEYFNKYWRTHHLEDN